MNDSPPITDTPLAQRIAKAPPLGDRRRAKAKLADLAARAADAPEADGLAELLREGPFADLIASLADHSPFLWQLAFQNPPRLQWLATAAPDQAHRSIVEHQRGIARRFAPSEIGRDAVMRELRRNRAAHALLVGLADIGGIWSVDEVTGALTAFADASVEGVLGVVLAEAAAGGKIVLLDPADPGRGSGFVILALGKHGAGELNYSSDIDLVVFFDGAAAPLAEGVEPTTFYTRVAKDLARLLQERTPDGYVHRVDYRLRPDPGSTPTAVSLASAYTYYETVGQNWERAALIKARPIAGDLALGERFLQDLTPFIWRKYFDFASIADVHAMKRQIHAVRGHDRIAVAGHDIKLGRGGIREIEFFVQTQQLVFGGRRSGLRGRRTLDMLAALHDEGWITAKARDELAAAYRFLRTVEHRLQMVADEQTQRLPSDEGALKGFAKFCGFPTLKAFETVLCRHAGRVQAHYALLFEEGPELTDDIGNLVFTGTTDDPDTLATLMRLGFKEPERAAETVRGWHFGRRPAVTSPRAREVLTELTPALLAALGGTADPDGALAALDRAFGRMPAVVELMTILQSHDRLRLLFADLLGTAPRLADAVAQSPHVLDTIIDPTFSEPVTDERRIEGRVRGLIGKPAHFEDFLDRIRDAARQIRFLAGARLLSGVFTPDQAGQAYAAIADAVVRAALEAVREGFEAEHGTVPGGRLAVVGLGRLGSRELTADSDLDLVVLYDFDEAWRESSGPRRLDAVVYYTRLTQRLVSALTAPTRRGRLYEVDLRLRPHGGKSPLAAQFKGFVAYERSEAELWEHMALTRARMIGGDEAFGQEVAQAIADIVGCRRDPAKVAAEVRAMRDLIAKEKGDQDPWDLKLAAGGLTDLDFLAQALVLARGADHPSFVGLPTRAALAEAGRLGLLAERDARALVEAHAFLSGVFQWQRLAIEGPFDATTVPPAILRRLATAAGLPDARVLLDQMNRTRAEVREVFSRTLDGIATTSPGERGHIPGQW
ncbi:MAG TPA: bifunctional [glutamine synthetase] adenylyltransferase/[glutamine synthetase]-adenylyl-L-tyrosine phosphorylase [Beijerinckiaceae bacterium]